MDSKATNIMDERAKIAKIMECEGLNAKQFSQEIGVSAGTISNIMGGRNKPSLEVMQAILRRFRTINCWWLIDNTGNMYVTTPADNTPRLPFPDEETGKNPVSVQEPATTSVSTTAVQEQHKPATKANPPFIPPRTVTKVMIFYSDGTFEER